MSSRTCPDWPTLMELAPDLQFKHVTIAEAHLPAEVLVRLSTLPVGAVALCCDLEHHVFHSAHTDPDVADALHTTHWYELREWAAGPGMAHAPHSN